MCKAVLISYMTMASNGSSQATRAISEEKAPSFISLSSLEGPARQGKRFTLTSTCSTQSLLPHLQGFFLWVTKQGTLDGRNGMRKSSTHYHIDEPCFVAISHQITVTHPTHGWRQYGRLTYVMCFFSLPPCFDEKKYKAATDKSFSQVSNFLQYLVDWWYM